MKLDLLNTLNEDNQLLESFITSGKYKNTVHDNYSRRQIRNTVGDIQSILPRVITSIEKGDGESFDAAWKELLAAVEQVDQVVSGRYSQINNNR